MIIAKTYNCFNLHIGRKLWARLARALLKIIANFEIWELCEKKLVIFLTVRKLMKFSVEWSLVEMFLTFWRGYIWIYLRNFLNLICNSSRQNWKILMGSRDMTKSLQACLLSVDFTAYTDSGLFIPPPAVSGRQLARRKSTRVKKMEKAIWLPLPTIGDMKRPSTSCRSWSRGKKLEKFSNFLKTLRYISASKNQKYLC